MAAAQLAAGRLPEAERDAHSAVDYFATTDMITFHANSALILGDVLRAEGRSSEAKAAYEQARDLYTPQGQRRQRGAGRSSTRQHLARARG